MASDSLREHEKDSTFGLIVMLIIFLPFGMLRMAGILWEDVALELTERFVVWQIARKEKRNGKR